MIDYDRAMAFELVAYFTRLYPDLDDSDVDRAIEIIEQVPDGEFDREDLFIAIDRACSERRRLPPQLNPEQCKYTKVIRQFWN